MIFRMEFQVYRSASIIRTTLEYGAWSAYPVVGGEWRRTPDDWQAVGCESENHNQYEVEEEVLGGDGVGGMVRGVGDLSHHGGGGNVPMSSRHVADVTLRNAYSTALCGRSWHESHTQTTASADRPRTVTFSQPRSQPQIPPASPAAGSPAVRETVSEGYYRVTRNPQSSVGGPSQSRVGEPRVDRARLLTGNLPRADATLSLSENLPNFQSRIEQNQHRKWVPCPTSKPQCVKCGLQSLLQHWSWGRRS